MDRTPARILTPRLLLRSFERTDTLALAAVLERSHAHLAPWVPLPAPGSDLEAIVGVMAARFASRAKLAYAILADDQLVGCVSLEPEGEGLFAVGYWLAAGETGKGYATEAAAAVCAAAPFLGATQLVLRCLPGNERSIGVALRLGFRLDTVGELAVWTREPERSVPRGITILDEDGARIGAATSSWKRIASYLRDRRAEELAPDRFRARGVTIACTIVDGNEWIELRTVGASQRHPAGATTPEALWSLVDLLAERPAPTVAAVADAFAAYAA